MIDVVIGLQWKPLRLYNVILWILFGTYIADEFVGQDNFYAYCIVLSLACIAVSILNWAVVLLRILILYPFPTCARHKCHTMQDYAWLIGSIYGRASWGKYRYWCNCGDEYVRVKRRFLRVLENGTTIPYKKLTGVRTWVDDRG